LASSGSSSDDGGDLLRARQHRRNAVDERHAHDYQLKANLFVTMQEEIGTAKQMVRVSRDALTSELRWALLHCDNCLAWEEHELPSGRLALFATGADIVSWSWICQLVGARDDEHAFAAPLPARRVRFRSATQRSTASSGTRASRFDDAQLTALSNLCEPSSSAAANAVDSDAVLAPLRAAGDLPTQGRARARLRFVAPQHRLSPYHVQAGHIDAVVVPPPSPLPRAARRVCSSSRRRRRQPQEPGPQPSRLDARASAV
jgi:hypothetical protein